MKLDTLIQFIVPLSFLAIWALTSLFNREAQPLPPRTGRSPNPGGGTNPQTTRITPDRRPTGQNYDSGVRRPDPNRAPQRPARVVKDDIVILESNTRRPGGSPQRVGSSSIRKTTRKGASPAVPQKRVETPTVRRLAGSMTSEATIASEVAQPRTLDKLSLPSSPLLSTNTSEPPKAMSAEWITDRTALKAADFRTLIESQHRLREAFIMNEILQPPVSMRGRGYGRR